VERIPKFQGIIMPKPPNKKVRRGKAKGRRLQKRIAGYISELTGIPAGKDEEIEAREMGQAGVDIKLYGKARKLFPFGIECKNQETWYVSNYIKQAQEYSNKDKFPYWLLFIGKNNFDSVVLMTFQTLGELDFPNPNSKTIIDIRGRKQWRLDSEVIKAREAFKKEWLIF